MVKALILTGYGINCDYETEFAFKTAGATTERVHINQLISKEKRLEDYHVLAIPGGFSFGDDLGSGKVLANKMKANIHDQIQEFIREEKLIIGICNGFQALVRYPLLPEPKEEEQVTLTFNDSGRFEDRWVGLRVNPNSPCVFFKGMESISLPVRHGEGKFITRDNSVMKQLEKNGQIVAWYSDGNGGRANGKYPLNPNGSVNDIAAVCDKTGRIFGLMPHPEAYNHLTNNPRWVREKTEGGLGLKVFRNAVDYVRENFD